MQTGWHSFIRYKFFYGEAPLTVGAGFRTTCPYCANWLTNPAFDPFTLTAEYKACAVRIDKS